MPRAPNPTAGAAVEVEGGKYRFYIGQDGTVHCDRYGEPWLTFESGGKALIALICEMEALQRQHAQQTPML